jgi:hypothetical protein
MRVSNETYLKAALSRHKSDACLIWPYGADSDGYGSVYIDGKSLRVHQAALLLTQGEPPSPDLICLHEPVRCHNRRCFNPRHLRYGTRRQNLLDRVADGTDNRGERSPSHKLTADDVKKIRQSSLSSYVLARRYGITRQAIDKARRGLTWRYV